MKSLTFLILLAIAHVFVGCSGVKVKESTTLYPKSGDNKIIVHSIEYERNMFSGQKIGELRFGIDKDGFPVMTMKGQESAESQLVNQVGNVIQNGIQTGINAAIKGK